MHVRSTDPDLPAASFPGSNMVELLQWRALKQPDRLLFTELADDGTPKGTLTCSELDGRSRAIAGAIGETVRPGERALLLYEGGLDFAEAFFACLYAGVVAVPVYPPDPTRIERTLPRFDAIASDAGPSLVLTSSALARLRPQLASASAGLGETDWVATDAIRGEAASGWREAPPAAEALALLQYTSGSTATPKGVRISHGNLLANQRMICEAFGIHPRSVGVSWLPVFHDMGLIGHVIQPVFSGVHNVLMSPLSFVKRPLRWLRAVSEFKANVSGAPNFAYEMCTRRISEAECQGLDLTSWEVAYCGAEPIDPTTLEKFAEKFAPYGFRPEALYPCYGLAEATLIVSGGARRTGLVTRAVDPRELERDRMAPARTDTGRRLVSCGHTLLEQRIRIVDPDRRIECGPGRVGEIWVSGANVGQGYWGAEGADGDAFGARLGDREAEGFLRTGDLGFMEEGHLFVTGRLKDVIILRGLNYYPQDIERTAARSDPSLRPGGCAAFAIGAPGSERVGIVQELRRRHSEEEMYSIVRRIRGAVTAEHRIQLYAVILVDPGTVPRTSSGKVRRGECREAFGRGELGEIYSWRRRNEDRQPRCEA